MKRKLRVDTNTEFELDLAPLLAVMVKLVPVLLLSSAFVQMMVIETDLPQVVQQAIERQKQDQKKSVSMEVSPEEGIKIFVEIPGGTTRSVVIPRQSGAYDYQTLYTKMLEVKKTNPEVFQIDLIPAKNVAYKDIVKIMDEVRKSHNASDTFPVFDEKKGSTVETNYMFPEIVFVNMSEG